MPTKEADAYFDAVSGMNAVSRGAYNYPVMLSTEHGLESYSADTAFSLNAPVLREPLLGIDAPGWQQTYERMIVSFGEPTAWAWCRDLPGVTRILPGPGKRSERDV